MHPRRRGQWLHGRRSSKTLSRCSRPTTRKVEELCEKARDADRKRALVIQIRTDLTVHAMLEEEIFYREPSRRYKRTG